MSNFFADDIFTLEVLIVTVLSEFSKIVLKELYNLNECFIEIKRLIVILKLYMIKVNMHEAQTENIF